MNAGRLIARVAIGGLFVGHGTQKLFGWFGGPGLGGTDAMMEKLELRPGRRHAVTASLAETIGGALLAIGALTPVAGSLITGTLGIERKGSGWALAALAAGAAGSTLAIEAGKRSEAEPEPTGRFSRERATAEQDERAGATA